jgi:hypothetical protein
VDAPLHVEGLGDGRKFPDEIKLPEREAVLGTTDTHEKCAIMQVSRMLVGLEDIPFMLKDKSRDGRYDAWLVRT